MPIKKTQGLTKRARDTWDSAEEKFEEARDRTKKTIKEYPFTSILIAAAVGAIVGVITSEIIRASRTREEESILKKLRKLF